MFYASFTTYSTQMLVNFGASILHLTVKSDFCTSIKNQRQPNYENFGICRRFGVLLNLMIEKPTDKL